MTDARRGPPGLVRGLARLLLALHPRPFRDAWRLGYLDAAAHRWRLERARRRRGAAWRCIVVLLRDAGMSLAAEWRAEVSARPGRRRGPGGWVTEEDGTGRGIESWAWELRTAARGLIRRPLFSGLVVGALGMGIAANGAIFRIVDEVVLHPLPFDGGDRMVYVVDEDVERGFTYSASQAEYERWKVASRTLEGLEAFETVPATLTGRGPATRVRVTRVSHGLLSMIRVPPVHGRGFVPGDAAPGAPPVAMIHEDYWRAAFGADPGAVGGTVVLDDELRRIVGIWPRSGRVQLDGVPDLLTPLPAGSEVNRSNFTKLLGRVAEGVGTAEVERELTGLKTAVDEQTESSAPRGERPRVVPPYRYVGRDFVQGLWVLYGGVGLLLVVAALNAANLLLDRAVDREAELGVRMALGGSTGRLVGLFLLEGGLLVAAATLLGTVLSRVGVATLVGLAPPDLPAEIIGGGGGRMGAYALALAVAAGLVCGLVPAVHLRSGGTRRLLAPRDGGPARSPRRRLQTLLVTTQVAMAVVLVVGSGLTFRSLVRLNGIELGFDADPLVVLSVGLPERSYPDEADRLAFFGEVLGIIRESPEVVSAAANGTLPLSYTAILRDPALLGDDREPVPGRVSASSTVSPDFLETLGIPVLGGRPFTEAEMRDGRGSRVVMVNEAFGRRYGGSVLGRQLAFSGDSIGWTIVGVVGDVRAHGIDDDPGRIQVYYPSPGVSGYDGSQRFHVRTSADPRMLVTRLRERIAVLEPDALLTDVHTGEDLVRRWTDEPRFLAVLLASCSVISLLLALAGVYGAVSLHVRRRRRETGIRIALGAGGARVFRGIVGAGLRPVILGVAIGLGGAVLLVDHLAAVLVQVGPMDPASFVAAVLIPVASGFVACVIPARRAVRVDPARTLRAE